MSSVADAAATNSTAGADGLVPEENDQNDRYKWIIWGIVMVTVGGFCINWLVIYVVKLCRKKVNIEYYLMECLDK